jgi:hypothetical protein
MDISSDMIHGLLPVFLGASDVGRIIGRFDVFPGYVLLTVRLSPLDCNGLNWPDQSQSRSPAGHYHEYERRNGT